MCSVFYFFWLLAFKIFSSSLVSSYSGVAMQQLGLSYLAVLPLGNQHSNKIPIEWLLWSIIWTKLYYIATDNSSKILFLHSIPAAGAPCSSPDYWCHLSPNYYAQIEIGEDSPAKVVCTIPYTNGYDVRIINQFGKDVHRDRELGPVLREYVKLVMNPLSNPIQHTQNKSFHYEIYRPKEKHLQEQLSIIQCIGIMRRTRHPCRTSLINIQFTDSEDIGKQNYNTNH